MPILSPWLSDAVVGKLSECVGGPAPNTLRFRLEGEAHTDGADPSEPGDVIECAIGPNYLWVEWPRGEASCELTPSEGAEILGRLRPALVLPKV